MLLVIAVHGAVQLWLLLLLLLRGHRVLVWGWKEQVGPPFHPSPAGRLETHRLPLSASVSPSVKWRLTLVALSQTSASADAPTQMHFSPFVLLTPQAPSQHGRQWHGAICISICIRGPFLSSNPTCAT